MKKRTIFTVLLLSGLISFAGLCGEAGKLEISEVAWSGTKASWADEWIEIRNTGESEINLEGFKLTWGDVKIHFGKEKENTLVLNNKMIPAGGFYLLERSDDNTVNQIKADLIFKGGLDNNGNTIELINDKGQTIDSLNFKEGWPAGTAGQGEIMYASMVKIEGEWVTSEKKSSKKDAEGNFIHGSPGA